MVTTGVPLPKGGEIPRVLTFGSGDKYVVRFLDVWLAVEVHYDPMERRSHPHNDPNCKWCDLPKKWRAYAPCQAVKMIRTISRPLETWVVNGSPSNWVFEFTEKSGEQFDGLPLRGVLAEFFKPAGAANQPLRFDILERDSAKELPVAFDVKPSLCRLWGDAKAFSDGEKTAISASKSDILKFKSA